MSNNTIGKQVSDIIKGHVKELLNRDEALSVERLKICETCPLLINTLIGPVCNSNMWINPETNETSTTAKNKYIRGCDCRLSAKTRLKDEKCIINKW